jgi:hypothetical protein
MELCNVPKNGNPERLELQEGSAGSRGGSKAKSKGINGDESNGSEVSYFGLSGFAWP